MKFVKFEETEEFQGTVHKMKNERWKKNKAGVVIDSIVFFYQHFLPWMAFIGISRSANFASSSSRSAQTLKLDENRR